MAVVFLTGAGNQGNVNSLTVAQDCTGASIIIAGVWSVGNTCTGITYAGGAMTQIGSAFEFTSGQFLRIYFRVSPATGSNNLVASFSGTQNCALRGICFSGTTTASIPDSSAQNSGATGTAVGTTTSVANNSMGVLFARFGGGDPSASTNMTSSVAMGATAGSFAIVGYSALKTPAGSLSMTATSTSLTDPWGSIIVSLAPFPAEEVTSAFFALM